MPNNSNYDILYEVTQGDLAESDDIELIYLICSIGEFKTRNRKRQAKRIYQRLDWEHHVAFLRSGRVEFESRYHMSERAFNVLCDILCEDLLVNFTKSFNSSGGPIPIYTELIVTEMLRFLGGEYSKSRFL